VKPKPPEEEKLKEDGTEASKFAMSTGRDPNRNEERMNEEAEEATASEG